MTTTTAPAVTPEVLPPALPKYQQHAIAEHAEMAARIDKLHTFFAGEVFPTLPQVEQELYRNQSLYLRLYNDQLAQRIALFTVNPTTKEA